MKTQTAAEQFFYAHAGWSFDPKTETSMQGKRRTAIKLAKAEAAAKKAGYTYQWTVDAAADPNDWDGDGKMGETAYACIMQTPDGKLSESLWGIWDPTPEYKRVIEAELAVAALGK